MKNFLAFLLLLVCSVAVSQERRPSYQGYGVPAAAPTPTPTSTEAAPAIEAEVQGQIRAQAKAQTQSEASAEPEAVSNTENETAAEPAAQPTPAANEGATKETAISLPIAETLPLEPSATESAETDTFVDKYLTEEFAQETQAVNTPVEFSPARWQLDLLVFRNGGQQSLRAERWPRNPGRPAIEQFDIAADETASSLTDVVARLNTSPSHQLLLQRTLMFDQLPAFLKKRGTAIESTQAAVDADLVKGHSDMPTPADRYSWPEVLGTVTLRQGISNAVSVDLLFTYTTALPYQRRNSADPLLSGGFEIETGAKLYQLGHIRLQQSAAATTEKLIYFDNPAIGAIVKLTEMAPQPIIPNVTPEPPAPDAIPPSIPTAPETGSEYPEVPSTDGTFEAIEELPADDSMPEEVMQDIDTQTETSLQLSPELTPEFTQEPENTAPALPAAVEPTPASQP